jgi:hypothetical protein
VENDHHNGDADEKKSQTRVDAHPADSEKNHCHRQERKDGNCDRYVHTFLD